MQSSLRLCWLDYLRGLNIVATLLFHSILAYSPFIQANDISNLPIPFVDANTTFPVADIFLLIRPIFSMQLMFFISGLFTWRSLGKRGPIGYVVVRFKRLILPLVITWLFIMPVTYVPAVIANQISFLPIRLAHLWFLWVLFVFDVIIAFIYSFLRIHIEGLIFFLNNFILTLLIGFTSVIAYLYSISHAGDTGWQPFFGSQVFLVPTGWLGLYFFYFLLGVVMGSRSLNNCVMSTNWFSPFSNYSNGLTRSLICAILVLTLFLQLRANIDFLILRLGLSMAWTVVNILYVLSGLLIVASLILLSKRFLRRQHFLLDNLSLNSYGLYLIHYTFVVWIQFFLSHSLVIGFVKPLVVILLCIPLSWYAADLLRRFPLLRSLFTSG
jgi:glucan biosynthesis protein C